MFERVFLLIVSVLIPLTMILLGRKFTTNPPKKINSFYGYRTAMSMKNQETWEFAQHKMGQLWQKYGWYILVLSVAVLFSCIGLPNKTISMVVVGLVLVQCLLMFLTIRPVEKALRANFDHNGERISEPGVEVQDGSAEANAAAEAEESAVPTAETDSEE